MLPAVCDIHLTHIQETNIFGFISLVEKQVNLLANNWICNLLNLLDIRLVILLLNLNAAPWKYNIMLVL